MIGHAVRPFERLRRDRTMQQQWITLFNGVNIQTVASGLLQKCIALHRPGQVVGGCTKINRSKVDAMALGQVSGNCADSLGVVS